MSKSKKKFVKNIEAEESSHYSKKYKQNYSKKKIKSLDRALKQGNFEKILDYQDTF